MNSAWTDLLYYFVSGAVMLLSLSGIWFARIMPGPDRWSKRFYILYFAVVLLVDLAGLAETVLSWDSPPETVTRIVLFLESILISLPIPFMTVYLLHCSGEKIRESRFFRIAAALWTLFFILLICSFFTSFTLYFSPEGAYYRASGFPLLMLPVDLIALLNLVGVIRRRGNLSRRYFVSFLISFLVTAAALAVHTFIDVFPLISFSLVLTAVFMFGFILSEQIRQYMRQQQELANQRAKVTVLQMRPHFIYNTMMGIYSLCRQDPQKARQVIMDFTNYLRKNFNAVASDSSIPFSAELEHTRAYLAVEQAQFEDLLLVEYDTPQLHFRLPPLTLQPIAENAVKHGINPDAGPLRITIRTRATDSGSEIIVEDNGPGFDASEALKPRTTLANIRQRLEMMCGGKMEIRPGDKGGTVVRMMIPRTHLQTEN